MSKELFQKQREQEIQNETLEDLEIRMQEANDRISENLEYFLTLKGKEYERSTRG